MFSTNFRVTMVRGFFACQQAIEPCPPPPPPSIITVCAVIQKNCSRTKLYYYSTGTSYLKVQGRILENNGSNVSPDAQ